MKRINNITLADLDLSSLISIVGEGKAALIKEVLEAQPDPWHAEARVVVTCRTTCACGQIYISPAAQDLLVRYRHERSGAVHERSKDVAMADYSLQIVQRILTQTCNVCPACVKGEDSQLNLNLQ